MSNPQNLELLHTLPSMLPAEEVDVNLLLAYREQLARQDNKSLFLRSEIAWNDLEIGFATRRGNFLDAAFAAFHELDEDPSANLERPPFLDVRTALAAEGSFRQRLDPRPIGRKVINRTYRQVGSVIQACLELDPFSPSARKLPGLIAYGALIRNKDGSALPYPGSFREKFGREADSHDFYSLQHGLAPRQKAALRAREEAPDQEPQASQAVKTAYMFPLMRQAVQSQDEAWAQAMTGGSLPRAQGKRWLRYVGEQLVRDSHARALTPEANRILDFMTSALHELLGIDMLVKERKPELKPMTHTSLADQLRDKFGL